MRRLILTAVALAAIATSTQGCAALVAGYLIGDGIARDKATQTCHANMKATNDMRLHKGEEPFPDTCGQ